ncbi:MAG: hypothetical protein HY398_02670 [Candidatus Doudnabacteria bacterium]|nr:hypothetical protein [Candidatus Doudnabacteria bacterium]
MKLVSDIAVLRASPLVGLQAFAQADSLSPKNTSFVWKSVLVALMLLLSLTASPLTASTERNLEARDVIAALNADRAQNDLAPLAANPRLEEAARKKAEDLLKIGYFAHTSPIGLEPWDFIRAAGFDYSYAGENLAMNYGNADELESDFLQSPSHRENLLSPNYTDVGVAVVQGLYQGQEAVITVQMFGTP